MLTELLNNIADGPPPPNKEWLFQRSPESKKRLTYILILDPNIHGRYSFNISYLSIYDNFQQNIYVYILFVCVLIKLFNLVKYQ